MKYTESDLENMDVNQLVDILEKKYKEKIDATTKIWLSVLLGTYQAKSQFTVMDNEGIHTESLKGNKLLEILNGE